MAVMPENLEFQFERPAPTDAELLDYLDKSRLFSPEERGRLVAAMSDYPALKNQLVTAYSIGKTNHNGGKVLLEQLRSSIQAIMEGDE